MSASCSFCASTEAGRCDFQVAEKVYRMLGLGGANLAICRVCDMQLDIAERCQVILRSMTRHYRKKEHRLLELSNNPTPQQRSPAEFSLQNQECTLQNQQSFAFSQRVGQHLSFTSSHRPSGFNALAFENHTDQLESLGSALETSARSGPSIDPSLAMQSPTRVMGGDESRSPMKTSVGLSKKAKSCLCAPCGSKFTCSTSLRRHKMLYCKKLRRVDSSSEPKNLRPSRTRKQPRPGFILAPSSQESSHVLPSVSSNPSRPTAQTQLPDGPESPLPCFLLPSSQASAPHFVDTQTLVKEETAHMPPHRSDSVETNQDGRNQSPSEGCQYSSTPVCADADGIHGDSEGHTVQHRVLSSRQGAPPLVPDGPFVQPEFHCEGRNNLNDHHSAPPTPTENMAHPGEVMMRAPGFTQVQQHQKRQSFPDVSDLNFWSLPTTETSSGEPHPCDVCGKVFAKYRYLIQHKNVHSAKRLVCELCGTKFKWRSSLNEHRSLYCKLRPGCSMDTYRSEIDASLNSQDAVYSAHDKANFG